MVGVQDMATLQGILDSEEQQELRREFLSYTTRAESQIQEQIG